MKCLAVLTEISGVVKQKRSATTSESLLHMIACITYYVAKVTMCLCVSEYNIFQRIYKFSFPRKAKKLPGIPVFPFKPKVLFKSIYYQ
jgi:hypothetical protein